jgi:hypothetical protein
MKLADIREKEILERFNIYKKETRTKNVRMKLNLIEEQWIRKFQDEKKIPPNDDEKKHSLYLKSVKWKQKEQRSNKEKEITVAKGKYIFKINISNCEVNNWEERWQRSGGRWKTNIDIFQDIGAEDLLTYLIIKDNSKEDKVTKEFSWEQIIRMIKKTTSLEFIDNSLQELTEFLILKNGFNETPIDKKLYILPKQIRIRKLQNMEVLYECIQRRNLIVDQK